MAASTPVPRRACETCGKSFKNARALKAHRWDMAQTDAAHSAARDARPRAEPVVQRGDQPSRVFDLTQKGDSDD